VTVAAETAAEEETAAETVGIIHNTSLDSDIPNEDYLC